MRRPRILRLRWVLRGKSFTSRRARARGFWHYVVRGHRCEICGGCGRPVGLVWMADDALWLEVMGSRYGVRCVRCFDAAADQLGITVYWHPEVSFRRELRTSAVEEVINRDEALRRIAGLE